MKRKALLILRILISLSLLFFIFKKVDFPSLLESLKSVHKGWLTLSLILNLLIPLILTGRWKIILSSKKIDLSFLSLLKLNFIGYFFNQFLPTGAGGDVVKGYYLIKEKERKIDLGTSIVFDRLLGTISIMSLAFFATFFVWNKFSPLIIFTIWFLFFLSIFFIFFFQKRSIARKLPPFIRNKEWSKNIYNSFHQYASLPKYFFFALLLSFIGQFISILTNYFLILSLGKTGFPFSSLLIFIPLIWAIGIVPSLGGLGVQEGAYILFFRGIIGESPAFGLSLIIRCFIILNGLIGGLIYLLFGGKTSSSQRPQKNRKGRR